MKSLNGGETKYFQLIIVYPVVEQNSEEATEKTSEEVQVEEADDGTNEG